MKNLLQWEKKILPFIRDEIKREYEKSIEYEGELDKIKIKVFGTKDIQLYDKNYHIICNNQEYLALEEKFESERGNPGIFWHFLIQEILPEFKIPVDGKAIIKNKGFIGIKVLELEKATVKWLDEYLENQTNAILFL